MRTRWFLPLAVAVLAAHEPAAADDPAIRVEVTSDFGAESKWVEPYVGAAAKALVELFANPDVEPPASVSVLLKKDPNAGGEFGWAGGGGIGFSGAAWPDDHGHRWIVAHELTNLFVAHYAGGGGFPSDWWSNGRSPFPEYVSCLVMRATGQEEAAKWRQGVMADRPDHALYWKLHDKYGFAMFARAVKLLRDDKVDLGAFGAKWPAPDRVRSAYTMAYLSLGAGTNLAALCREHGVGREPSDWKQRHGEIAFVEYEVTPADVDAILAAREWLFGQKADAAHFDGLRDAYRRGGALNTAPTEVSPIAFSVVSAFGKESDWVRPFLDKAPFGAIDRFGGPDRRPPEAVSVRLDLDPKAGGIAGGVQGVSMSYESNVWPEETFRVWVLTRDLVGLLFRHYGGTGVPSDLWSAQAFGDVAAVALLRDTGHAAAADFVEREMTKSDAHRAVRSVTGARGLELWARFLKLLRDDKVDLAKIGAPWPAPDEKRSLYFAAYLSIAADENLAKLLRTEGLGKRPSVWDAQHPGVKFEEYEVTEAEVAAVMKQREKLFTKDAKEEAREHFRRGDSGPK